MKLLILVLGLSGCMWPYIDEPWMEADTDTDTDTDIDTDIDTDTDADLGCNGLVVPMTSAPANPDVDDSWTEQGVAFSANEGWFERAGSCLFIGGFEADFSGLDCEVTRVEWDVVDWCGEDCTVVRGYSDGSSVDEGRNDEAAGDHQDLVVEWAEGLDQVTIFSYEAEACELVLY